MSRRRIRCRIAANCLVGAVLVAGCHSSSSYATLAKLGRSVPTPPGLTYVREVDHVNHAEFGGTDQKEVDLLYSAPGMTCVQLSRAWRNAIDKAGWQIDTSDSGTGPGAFYLKKDGILIAVDPGGSTGVCDEPRVAVGKTP